MAYSPYSPVTWNNDNPPAMSETNLNRIEAGIAIIHRLTPAAQGTPDMTIKVSSAGGSAIVFFTENPTYFADGNSPTVTAPTANPRIDLLVLNSSGTLEWVTGTEAVSPSPPSYPIGKIPICEVYNRIGETSIKNQDDATNGYIYRDCRFFLNLGGISRRYDEVTKSITFATADAPTGDDDSITMPVQTGLISRLRIRAGSAGHFKAGQQVSGTALVNSATGITPAATTIAYDGQSPADAFAVDDYVQIDNEIMLVTLDDGATLTVTRARKDTIAEYHDDNAVITKCNGGLRIAFYPNSSYNEKEKFFEWTNAMIAEFVTDAAITAGDTLLGLTTDPTVLPDLGIGDLIYIDDTSPEEAMVQSVFGDVANATYDNTISVQGALAAHAITKDIERILQYDIPIPFSFASGTTLYIRINLDEKITENISITITVLVDA